MTDIEKARQLFRDAGLAFPTVPTELAAQLKEKRRWLFSTRPLEMSPYNLQHYIEEAQRPEVKDYAVLSRAGHGVNSYVIQYYLVHGSLHMFLHLGWGGVYMDAAEAAAQIRDCFSMADQLATASQKAGAVQAGERLTVVASNFYGGYWLPPGKSRTEKNTRRMPEVEPMVVLTEALGWLSSRVE